MDKSSFETYEYLQANNNEGGTDEYLIVQDDGTFLVNRQVQYVTQVQDTKDVLDSSPSCKVYDVSPQEFFVNVTNNSTELISVDDNYILPVAEETNSLYSNSFLLQAEANEDPGQDIKNPPDETKESEHTDEVDVVNIIEKQPNNCTEITLSDEQYTALEEKGWVLLKINGKSFMLDSFGLHDITDNSDLIQSLQANTKDDDSTSLDPISSTLTIDKKNSSNLDESAVQVQSHKQTGDYFDVNKKDPEETNYTPQLKRENTDDNTEVPNKRNTANTIKIKTKYCFNKIPDKIVLGKTINGKKLVAKVVKRIQARDTRSDEVNETKPSGNATRNYETTEKMESLSSIQGDDSQFEKLLQQALDGKIKCSAEHIAAAKDIITQLSQVPALKSSFSGHNVIITKYVEKKTESALLQQSRSFVTGVVNMDKDGYCSFSHVSDLLQKLMTQSICADLETQSRASRSILKPKSELMQKNSTVLHIHVTETTNEDTGESLSVTLNERVLPCEVLTAKQLPASKPATKLHACGTCAKIFQTVMELVEHQEIHTMDHEVSLTIDTDTEVFPKERKTNPFVLKSGREYACFQCNMRFNRRLLCLRHMNTHVNGKKPMGLVLKKDNQDKLETSKQTPMFKCRICSCSYFYQSSLSKHISRVHIKQKITSNNW